MESDWLHQPSGHSCLHRQASSLMQKWSHSGSCRFQSNRRPDRSIREPRHSVPEKLGCKLTVRCLQCMFLASMVSVNKLLMRRRSNQHPPRGMRSDRVPPDSVQEYMESGRKILDQGPHNRDLHPYSHLQKRSPATDCMCQMNRE